jgi:hypothetical protein
VSTRLLTLILLLCFVSGAGAEMLRLETAPVEINFEQRNQRVARRVAEIIERDVHELATEIGLERVQPFRVEVVDDMRPYRHALREQLPVWGVAFALLSEQVIVVDVKRATRAYNTLDKVIPHELSHLLFAQRVGHTRFPVWFLEGMAQWQAGEWSLVDSWQLMNAVWSKDTPTLRQIMNQYPAGEARARSAYRVSYAAFTDLFKDDFTRLPEFLDHAAITGSFEEAFFLHAGETMEAWMASFQDRLERRYHSRLLVFQTGPLFSMAAVLFMFVALRAWLRKRRRMRELAEEEAGRSP